MSFPFKPIGEMIIAKIIKTSKTLGGLFIPEGAKETKMSIAEVLEIGTGTVSITGNRIPMDVQVGDYIVFGSHRAMGIDYGIRTIMARLGIPSEELDQMVVVVQAHLLGKIRKEDFERALAQEKEQNDGRPD